MGLKRRRRAQPSLPTSSRSLSTPLSAHRIQMFSQGKHTLVFKTNEIGHFIISESFHFFRFGDISSSFCLSLLLETHFKPSISFVLKSKKDGNLAQ